jgi:hypothetical protein
MADESSSPNKSPGQIAYEAYCGSSEGKSLISGATLPAWENQNPQIQQAWEAAASAVVRASEPAPPPL